MREPETYTDAEVEDLALKAYARKPVRCPRCSGRVRARELGILGRKTIPLMLSCERCAATGQYSPDHLEAMDLEWSNEEKVQIVERFWASGRARCPKDSAVLKSIRSKSIGVTPSARLRCPLCGRSCSTREVDEFTDPDSYEGRYEELHALDEGGMGTVFLVRCRKTDQNFAAKRIKIDLLKSEEAVRRFQRESRILEKLSHASVVPIHETFIDERGGVIVMPVMKAGTLAEAISRSEVSNETLMEYFVQVVDGLAYLHEEGVIHRDLKPSNVLIDSDTKSARISDFGLARLILRDSTPLTSLDRFLGTTKYAAPEQMQGARDVTASCDIYSLALIAYEIAARQSPHTLVNLSGLPGPLQEQLEKCLTPVPDERPRSGKLLAEEMARHLLATA